MVTIAFLHARIGDEDAAIDWLGRALDALPVEWSIPPERAAFKELSGTTRKFSHRTAPQSCVKRSPIETSLSERLDPVASSLTIPASMPCRTNSR